MAAHEPRNVDYRLLNKLSRLVICSRCFQDGRITPVPQVINERRKPENLCSGCRPVATNGQGPDRSLRRRRIARLLSR